LSLNADQAFRECGSTGKIVFPQEMHKDLLGVWLAARYARVSAEVNNGKPRDGAMSHLRAALKQLEKRQ